MKAVQIKKYGNASVMQIEEVNKPLVSNGQVLIEVYASSINPIDTMLRSGYVREMMPLTFPATLGGDFAGVVAEVGDGVTGFVSGDKVYGQANAAFGNSGAFAEFAVTAAEQVAISPKNIDFNNAASLPLVGVSALQALTEHIKLAKEQKILVIGGSGGIGTLAIQIAKHLGAYVATTATGDGLDVVKRLGADEIIDYAVQNVEELLNDFDAVFDTVGGDNFDKALSVLKKGGIAVTMATQPNDKLAAELGVTALAQMTQVTTERLEKLAELVENGAVKPQVDKVFSMDAIIEAFESKESGNVVGKVVIEVK